MISKNDKRCSRARVVVLTNIIGVCFSIEVNGFFLWLFGTSRYFLFGTLDTRGGGGGSLSTVVLYSQSFTQITQTSVTHHIKGCFCLQQSVSTDHLIIKAD